MLDHGEGEPEGTNGARLRAVLTLLATLAFALAPFLIDSFGGYPPDAFPVSQLDPPVQPAGYAFAIWGLIYLWLLAHAGFGLWRRAAAADWDRARWPLIVSLAVGAFWLPVAQTSPPWATVMIWIMLGGALLARARAPGRDRWLAAMPLGLYAGWLTAASFVSLGLLAAGYGLVGPLAAAVLALGGALAFAVVARLVLRPSPAYALAVAWAFLAVAVANWPDERALAASAAIAAIGVWLLPRLKS